METREQLEKLRPMILDGRMTGCVNPFVELIDKLIAERPYEPGERVLFCGQECEFYGVKPYSGYGVYLLRRLSDGHILFASHAAVDPLPKTYRVTVPEEVIDKAREITASRVDDVVAANEVCNWLANPNNWEE